jgi:site-specific DNA recombinase
VTDNATKFTRKAAVYGRVSTQDQAVGYSLAAQLEACHQWAEKNGHKVVREYVEEGHSAFRNLDKREAFKELLSDAASKEHPFDLIIVHKLDRLFRDSLESSTTRAILKQKHVRLVSITEPMVGANSPEDFFMEHILVGMAEFYSRNLSREIMKGLKQRAQQGHLVFRPPYGYRREIIERQEGHKRTRIVSRAVIDQKSAGIVKRIFEQFDQGMGYKSIVLSLNDNGYRTEQGQRFRVYHIARILRNKAYIGILEYNFRQDRGAREPVIVPKFYPPMIDAELFNRVQEKLKSTSSFWQNAHAHRTDYLLSGLVKCDACGHRYVGTSAKGGRFHYYTCQSYVKRGKGACDAPLLNKDRLEKGVLDQIQKSILSPENVRQYIETLIAQARSEQQPSAEEKAVSLALEDTDAKLRRWEEALERGLLSLEDAAHRIKELRHERAALLKTKNSLEQKSRSTAKILPIPTPLMNTYIREIQERLRAKKIGYKKEFLREIIKEVRVKGREITLTYKIPLAPKNPSGEGSGGEFFTVLHLVVAAGLEPATSRM